MVEFGKKVDLAMEKYLEKGICIVLNQLFRKSWLTILEILGKRKLRINIF